MQHKGWAVGEYLVPIHTVISMRCVTYLNAIWGNLPALKMGQLIGGPVLNGDIAAGCQLGVQCGGWSSHKERNAAQSTQHCTPGRLIWSFMTGPTNHLTEAHAANAYGLLESIVTVP